MLEVHGGLLAWTVITFILLLVVLRVIAWNPILSALESREKMIRESLKKADDARNKADDMAQEYDEMIARSRKEGQDIIAASKEAGDKLKNEIEMNAKSKANKIIDDSKLQIEMEKQKVIAEIRNQVVELSLIAAERIIKKSLDNNDNQKLVQDAIKEYGQN